MPQHTRGDQQSAAENQQKVWATLLDILKVIITLSTAIIGAWAIFFSDSAKIPADWKKWPIVFAIIFAVLSMLASILGMFNINRQIVGISRGILDNTERTKGRRLIIVFGNASFFLFLFSVGLVAFYVISRATSSPTNVIPNPEPQTQTQIQAEINTIIEEIRPKLLNQLRVEIESLIGKMQGNIDKLELQAEIKAYLRNISIFKPERLQQFTGFELGSSELTADMEKEASALCERLRYHDIHQDGLLLAIGAVDRVPLGASIRLRYESNLGLAQARAEEVKSEILKCGVSLPVLTLVSGPRMTADRTRPTVPDVGTPGDRGVDVWAFWTWRDSP